MNDFEKLYYEEESFWQGEMLNDIENKERFRVTAELVPSTVKSLVDIGCGNGVFLNYLEKKNPHLDLMGVDRSEMALKFVNSKKELAEIHDLPFSDHSYDCVSCLEVIEHLPLPIYRKSLSELARISKKYIIVSVPYNEKLEESHNQCPACKSIFNFELHLRSFDEQNMTELFDDLGFKCVILKKLNPTQSFKGHYVFRKFFYPKQFLMWKSPICPICGFIDQSNKINKTRQTLTTNRKRSILSYFTKIPKLFWPKEERYYWILAMYERVK
jgi:SAM-dependent methyltransferase